MFKPRKPDYVEVMILLIVVLTYVTFCISIN